MRTEAPRDSWKNLVADRIGEYGHRNWVVIADAAYPSQVAAGIETVTTGADHFEVLQMVLDAVEQSDHVRAIVHLDAELSFLGEPQLAGIETFRTRLDDLLEGQEIVSFPHEEIIGKLDEAGSCFNVLLLKTRLLIPYTSIFLQLDCGYWDEASETALRRTMGSA